MITTKLTKAASNRQSLRTTVPEEVVQELGLKDGETVEWVAQHNSIANKKWFVFRKK